MASERVWQWVGGLGVALILIGGIRALSGASGGVILALLGVAALALSRLLPRRPVSRS